MSELFASNEKLYLNSYNKLRANIETGSYQAKGNDGMTEGKQDLHESEQAVFFIRERPEKLRQMEIELAVLSAQAKSELKPRVSQYRMEFDQTKRNFGKLLETMGFQKDKEILLPNRLEDVFL